MIGNFYQKMTDFENLLYKDPYSLIDKKKNFFFKKKINELTIHHFNNCLEYKKILKFLKHKKSQNLKIEEIPFIPVRLFKEFDLLSVNKKKIIKILNSSGTSNNKLSKIYLDKKNSDYQLKVLQAIMSKIIGNARLPMLIIDKKPNIDDRQNFNAKIAAINGFSVFGKYHHYLLNDNDEIDYKSLDVFLSKYSEQKFFIFGFTSMIFENLIQKLDKKFLTRTLHKGILLHGGGWKKLENQKISNSLFKKKLNEKLKLTNIYNYYGLIEQTGSIFIECRCGYFVSSSFSEVIVRNNNLQVVKNGSKGFLQLLSLLPSSYPGHSILTEDIGQIIDRNKCNCSLHGTRFLVHGRLSKAEIRGCSDV